MYENLGREHDETEGDVRLIIGRYCRGRGREYG